MSSRYPSKRDAGLRREDYGMTLEAIGKELGITRERARQLEANALRKARKVIKQRGFTLQDLLPEGERHD